jgi:hypothetical protein
MTREEMRMAHNKLLCEAARLEAQMDLMGLVERIETIADAPHGENVLNIYHSTDYWQGDLRICWGINKSYTVEGERAEELRILLAEFLRKLAE